MFESILQCHVPQKGMWLLVIPLSVSSFRWYSANESWGYTKNAEDKNKNQTAALIPNYCPPH